MKLKTIFIVLLTVCLGIFSCSKDDNGVIANTTTITVPSTTNDTLLYFTSVFDGLEIPMVVRVPKNAQLPLPAVVVMHGSGGGWKDEDTDNDGQEDLAYVGELSTQNEEWAQLLNEEGYIAVFPESYNARGTVEAHDEWDLPPLVFKISAQEVRSRDAVQTLETLLKLKNENGQSLVRSEDVGLLGFSDGGASVYATVHDHPNVTPEDFEWIYRGEYEMMEPLNTNEVPRYAAAVTKYGGAGHYGFYGSLSDCSKNIYRPYCPIRIEIGEKDGLIDNNEKLAGCLEAAGVNMQYQIYPDAPHGYDTDDVTGPVARQHTLEFFATYLKD